MSYFIDTAVNIEGNSKLRTPQIEAYLKIKSFFCVPENKEALVVLPTGTGKSGLISIAPFGSCNGRVLIVTPGLVTKDSIRKTQEALYDNFWINFDVLFNHQDLPVTVEYSAGLLRRKRIANTRSHD
ncbi:type III restriction endonuclease subunit R [Pseudomonas sp. BF-R-26]|uniref:type III restriction endonuclease subunit R n=1 Tax=Pseudomonas sp. BF-R-26 TaxID=2832398 RepID=UPI0021DB7B8D|nr:type III restriction endonuclease subunit R [Pseudomonas sp. BF-R-26]